MLNEIRMTECPYCEETFDLNEDNWIGFGTNPIGICPKCHQLVFVDNGVTQLPDPVRLPEKEFQINPSQETREAFSDCDNLGERMDKAVGLIDEALDR